MVSGNIQQRIQTLEPHGYGASSISKVENTVTYPKQIWLLFGMWQERQPRDNLSVQ